MKITHQVGQFWMIVNSAGKKNAFRRRRNIYAQQHPTKNCF